MLTKTEMENEIRFEQTLAFHCAPSLAGIKPADLISWQGTPGETGALLAAYSQGLGGAGICFRLLCRCRSRCLVLVYRQGHLERQLKRPEVRALLRQDGYPVDGGVDAMLDHLGERMARSDGFPHEVGLFLGYPAEDVEGFRRNGGQGYKCCGLWKVYSDVERAQRCFAQYDCCRRGLCRRVQSGCRLSQLFRTKVKAADAVFIQNIPN